MPHLSRRERERRARVDAILGAARHVFAEKGYEHATLDEVAERAEFGKGTLYNYVDGGKEGLLLAIFERVHDELREVVAGAFTPQRLADRTWREALEAFFGDCLRFLDGNADVFRLMVREISPHLISQHEDRAAFLREQRQQVLDALAAPLARAIDDGALRPVSPLLLAGMMLGNLKMLQMHRLLTDDGQVPCSATLPAPPSEELGPQEAARFLTGFFFDGFEHDADVPASAANDALAGTGEPAEADAQDAPYRWR